MLVSALRRRLAKRTESAKLGRMRGGSIVEAAKLGLTTLSDESAARLDGLTSRRFEALLRKVAHAPSLAPPVPAPPRRPRPGERVGGYRLERMLGKGGSGEVWLAQQGEGHPPVALKLLYEDLSQAEHRGREWRATSRLCHPHIVPILDAGTTYLAFPYVAGENLAERVRQGLSPDEAVHVVLQIASALSHAHERGIVHCDIKPSNILLDGTGDAYLTDFGICMLRPHEESARGTPAFMAPEQRRGDRVGPTADQYALAKTLLVALLGEQTQSTADWRLALSATAARSLVPVLERALSPSSAKRWPSVRRFSRALVRASSAGVESRAPRAVTQCSPLRWLEHPDSTRKHGFDIIESDHHLGALAAAGHIDIDQWRTFQATTGYTELAWSAYARRRHLGRTDWPPALGRASEVIVLLHAFGISRKSWHRTAVALSHRHGEALVLVPDLYGFGASRTVDGVLSHENLHPEAIFDSIIAWLELLGLARLPTVVVGHSMSALATLTGPSRPVPPKLGRVAVAPFFPARRGSFRVALRLCALISQGLWNQHQLRRPIGRALSRRLGVELSDEELDASLLAMSDSSPSALRRLLWSMADWPLPRPERARSATIIASEADPVTPPFVMSEVLAALSLDESDIVRLEGKSHCAHFESEGRPDRTHRNVAAIVRAIGEMMARVHEEPALTNTARPAGSGVAA